MPALTKNQQRLHNYLSAEYQRKKGSLEEMTSYPRFYLDCGQCLASFNTSDCLRAQRFITDHQGHVKFSFEIHQRPSDPDYDREEVLDQLKDLGLYIAWVEPHGEAIEFTRQTYKLIRAEAHIGGALHRLMSAYKDQGRATHFMKVWLRCIINMDQKGLEGLREMAKEAMEIDPDA